MSNPTLSRTFVQIIQDVGTTLGDIIIGTAAGGSSTTLTDTQNIDALPAGKLIGSELTATAAADSSTQTRDITGHTKSGGTVTLTVPSWTAPTAADAYEIHNLDGQGWTREAKKRAVNAAVEALAENGNFTDQDIITLASERGNGRITSEGLLRYEYPLPTSFLYLWDVAYLRTRPLEYHQIGYLNTVRNFGDAAGRTRVSQGFQISQQSLVSYIAVFMGKVLAPTDNLTCVVETNSSGIPSGTPVTNGTSATVAGTLLGTRARYVVFTFEPPMLLLEDTTYHLTLRRSGAADASNYYWVGEDDGNNYPDGTLSTRDASAWTAVSGSDLLFAISPRADWVSLAPAYWSCVPASTDQLSIRKLPSEGVPIRLRGGAAIARLSAEADTCGVRPDWVVTYAVAYLKASRTGVATRDNNGQGMQAALTRLGISGTPMRAIPHGARRVM